jgi:NTE family protein
MHEHRIPVDAVAGTSMGGLVAGMFATGNNPDQMIDFISALDWNQTLQLNPPFPQLAYRRKEDQRQYPNTFELGYKKGRGVSLPTALSAGHGVGLLISRFAASYSEMKSFDDLPTPFRCVAGDLVKGSQYVFKSGSLPEALRSTMSIPGVFAPVEKDGMLLVDGGMLNNLPVDVVKAMGVDAVIAVSLDVEAPEMNKMKTLFGVAKRSLSVMITDNELRNKDQAAVVVSADLKGLGGSDYPKYMDFIDRGYKAAEAVKAQLEKYAVSPEEYRAWLDARLAKRRTEEVRPKEVLIDTAMAPRLKASVIRTVSGNKAEPVDRAHMEDQLTKLVGAGRYDAASYSLFKEGEREGVKLAVHEKEHGPPFIKPSFLLYASPDEGLKFGVGARITFLDAGGPASEWRTDLSIGMFNRIGTEYYYRIKGGKWFFAPQIGYEENMQPIYVDGKKVSEFKNRRSGGGVDIGYAFGRFQELRLGYTLTNEKSLISAGPQKGQSVSGRASSIRFKYAYEGQDAPNIPTRGLRMDLSGGWTLDWPGVSSGFPVVDASMSYAKPLPHRMVLIGRGSGGGTKDDYAVSSRFDIGGPLMLSSLGRSELLGSRYYYGGAYLLREISDASMSVLGKFYLMGAYEAGNAWTQMSFQKPRQNGTVGIIGDTAFGVVLFGFAYGDQGDGKVFFRLGRFF